MGLPPNDAGHVQNGNGPLPGHVQNGNGTLPQAVPQSGGGHCAVEDSDSEDFDDQFPNSSSSVLTFLPDEVILSPLGNFASSSLFQNFTLFVIVLNGLWIGVDVEWNHESLRKNGKLPLEPVSTVVEHLFCTYFSFEILVRIGAFGRQNVQDPSMRTWFIFDFVLVLMMVIETWIMLIIEALMGGGGDGILSKFSCLRLLRLTRLMRIMTSLPELLVIVRGMINAAKSVIIVLLFMILLMFVFAIIFTSQIGDPDAPEHSLERYWVRDEDPTGVELFGTMMDSMMSLFTRGLLGDNLAETLVAIKDMGGKDAYSCEMVAGEDDDGNAVQTEECGRTGGALWLMWAFVFFMCISAFCLLNMLIGVLCEVIGDTASAESESNQVHELQTNIYASFRSIDASGDNLITKKEWEGMKNTQTVRQSFINIGVEENLVDSRMDQIEESLFGRLNKHSILKGDGWRPPTSPCSTVSMRSDGIPLEEFFSQILEIRPDADISFMDLMVLQTRAEKDESIFNKTLDNIQRMLSKGRTFSGNGIADIEDYEARSPSITDAVGMVRGVSNPAEDNKTSEERIQEWEARILPVRQVEEEPNNGTTTASDVWLMGLSTEVLFAELQHRAMLPDGANHPAILVD